MIKRLLNLISDTFKRFIDWITHVDYRHIFLDIANFIGDIMHRALFDLLLPKKYRTLTKQEIFTIIFKSDTPRGKKFDIWLLILIGLNVMVIMLESVSDAPKWFTLSMNIIGWLFTLLFTFEFYLRIYCLEHPRKYIVSLFGIIDIISIFPAYLSIFLPAASTLSVLRLMRVLRIFRIFRMERFIEESRFLINALRRSATKILVFMLFVFIMAVILGATMYGIEGEKNPDISSIPRGVYWAVVTITTVGYGDIAPVTATGQFISMIVMLLGYSIIAVPTGIVAGDTIEEYRNQEEGISSALLAAQKTADEIVAEAQRKSTRMLNESEQKLRTRNQELMLEVNAEQERVTLAKQAAAKFIVELQDRVQAQLVTLEKLKQMDLTVKSGDAKEEPSRVTTGSVNPLLRRAVAKPQPAPEEKPEDTVREIEENISRILAESGDQSEIDNTKVMKPVK